VRTTCSGVTVIAPLRRRSITGCNDVSQVPESVIVTSTESRELAVPRAALTCQLRPACGCDDVTRLQSVKVEM